MHILINEVTQMSDRSLIDIFHRKIFMSKIIDLKVIIKNINT